METFLTRRGPTRQSLSCALLVFVAFSGWIHAGAVPEENIRAAAEYSARSGESALVIRQNDQTLFDRTSKEDSYWTMSITKNLAALATFAAASDGLLDLDEPVSATLTEWRDDPAKKNITLRALLDQTSGLATGYEEIYRKGVKDKNRAALHVRTENPPGEAFRYAPSNYEVLHAVLERKLAPRGETPLDYLKRRVLVPAGIAYTDWRLDQTGHAFFSTGWRARAQDLLRLGTLVAARGKHWFTSIVPGTPFEQAAGGSAANPAYGLSFWLNANASRPDAIPGDVEEAIGHREIAWSRFCLSRHAPSDLIALVGSGGQRVYISRSAKLVAARTGHGGGFSDTGFLDRLFGR